jgi:sarcosine oxidase
MTRYDACVVGLGTMGAHTALELRRRGASVVGLDRYSPPHDLGSSHGKTRVIREAYFEHPLYVPIIQRAYELWERLEQDSGRSLVTYTGGLMMGPPDGPIAAGARRSAVEHGLPYEELGASEIMARVPVFEVPDGVVGIYEPRAGVVAAESSMLAVLELAAAAGCELRFDEEVLSWERVGPRLRVSTTKGHVVADALVLAGGPWMTDLVEVRPSLSVARQPLVWFDPTARHELFESIPVFLWETPNGDIFYGFPRDESGLKMARHHRGELTSPSLVNRELMREDEELLRGFLSRCMPDGNGPLLEYAICMYTNTPDWNFVLDRLPNDDRVVVVSACSGHGFKFSPAIGEIAADLVTWSKPSFDLRPFRFGR